MLHLKHADTIPQQFHVVLDSEQTHKESATGNVVIYREIGKRSQEHYLNESMLMDFVF